LREESEGYSKLMTELGAQANLTSRALENIQSLIGCFNLDPNRVLDIILESFENNTHMHETFIGLLRHYKAEEDTICQIVGFKFQSLHQQQLAQQAKVAKDQPMIGKDGKPIVENLDAPVLENINLESLYKVAAYLLKFKIIDLDLLMPHV
jgi:hypothetical protein